MEYEFPNSLGNLPGDSQPGSLLPQEMATEAILESELGLFIMITPTGEMDTPPPLPAQLTSETLGSGQSGSLKGSITS